MGHIAIAGAGLAGLAAATAAIDHGHTVTVLEKQDGPGGRVRTDEVDGYRLDRGFQILLTAYPAAQRVLDYGRLDLRRFQAGALVQTAAGRAFVGDPIRRPGDLFDTITSPIGSPSDKARLLLWRRSVMSDTVDRLWKKGEVTTGARFGDLKFSDSFVDGFLRPLFAGIALDPDLEVSSRFTEFVFRMLAEGYGAVPSRGMGEIPRQLAERLPDGTIRYGTPVRAVTSDALETEGGERVEADAVIVATDMDAAADLLDTPQLGWSGVTTRWFSADSAPYDQPLLFLNGTGGGAVNNVAVMSTVSPHYAPRGKHLVAVSSSGTATDADAVNADLRAWFGRVVDSWELLRTDEIARAQPRYLPGEDLPARPGLDSGVFVAGDHRANPSIDGAFESGLRAARAVFDHLSKR